MAKQRVSNQYGFPSGMLFWCLGFLYASFMALMFQKLILPMLPDLHAGNGLLNNDAVLFHELARHAADLIREQGWSQWRLFADGFGNVGLLSAVYAIFGPNPIFFIPITAAAHATGALMIYLLGQRLWPGRIGCLGGLIAGILFLVFPSALQWYGQNHKDAFAIAGILAMLFAWLSVFDHEFTGKFFKLVLLMLTGAVLLAVVRLYYPILVLAAFSVSWFLLLVTTGSFPQNWRIFPRAFCLLVVVLVVSIVAVQANNTCVRPHYPVLVLAAFSVSWFLLFVVAIVYRSFFQKWRIFSRAFCLLVVVLVVSIVAVQANNTWEGYFVGTIDGSKQSWNWKRSEILPEQMDRVLERISRTRAHFIEFNRVIGAGSMIDADRSPDDAASLFAYLPRALVVGVFAPFPNTWAEKVSPPRLVGAVETAVWYIVAAGIFVLLVQHPSRPLFAGLIFALCLITVLSYVHPNVGTLYRQRFGFWLFILLCGAVGWAKILLGNVLTHPGKDHALQSLDPVSSLGFQRTNRMETLAASGSVVLLITLCCYLGFMARDLMLVRFYGMNAELDAFFSASMIPMFLVTFLAMPMSDALTAPFLRGVTEKNTHLSEQLVRKVMSIAALILGTAAVVVVLLADKLLPMIIGTISASALREGTIILRMYAPIVLLSVWTVLGNSILNALQYSRQAALIQMLVPVVTIGAILVVPADRILYGAAMGMLGGTLLNAVLVLWLVKRLGYTLWPAYSPTTPALQDVSQTYQWLAAAAFFTVVATPLNYFFAGTIEHGAIAAWALASKMVMLFNGLASVGLAAVILPHLAHLMEQGSKHEMKTDVFFLLLSGTWIGFGLALVVFVFSEPMIFALIHGGQVSDIKIKELADVVKLGCLQLPMVVAYAVIVKVAAVTGRSGKVVLAALASVAINVGCNLILVPQFGVLGLALSSVVATGVSSAFLLVVTRNVSLLSMAEIMVLILSWIILAFIGVYFHFSYSGAITSAGFGLLSLACTTWWVWRSRGDDVLA